MADKTCSKNILAIDRRYRTKGGKARGEITYFHDGKDEGTRTDAVIPWLIEDPIKGDPEKGTWTNLLRWYHRTKDLPGARAEYDRVSYEAEKT